MNDPLKDHEWNIECPGYGEEPECGELAAYKMRLINDPQAFCYQHAMMAAQFWMHMGFPSPVFELGDGRRVQFQVVED